MQLVAAAREGLVLTLPLPAAEVPEDAALARAAARGDRAAFEKLVIASQRVVFGICYRLLGNHEQAADAAQETFVRAFAALRSYDPSQKFEVWLLRIARNHCFDQLRHRQVAPADPDEAAAALPDHAPSAEERVAGAEATHDLEEALSRLPERDREVIALYHLQHRPTREVAQILGTPPGTVMARLFRARAKLREMLVEHA